MLNQQFHKAISAFKEAMIPWAEASPAIVQATTISWTENRSTMGEGIPPVETVPNAKNSGAGEIPGAVEMVIRMEPIPPLVEEVALAGINAASVEEISEARAIPVPVEKMPQLAEVRPTSVIAVPWVESSIPVVGNIAPVVVPIPAAEISAVVSLPATEFKEAIPAPAVNAAILLPAPEVNAAIPLPAPEVNAAMPLPTPEVNAAIPFPAPEVNSTMPLPTPEVNAAIPLPAPEVNSAIPLPAPEVNSAIPPLAPELNAAAAAVPFPSVECTPAVVPIPAANGISVIPTKKKPVVTRGLKELKASVDPKGLKESAIPKQTLTAGAKVAAMLKQPGTSAQSKQPASAIAKPKQPTISGKPKVPVTSTSVKQKQPVAGTAAGATCLPKRPIKTVPGVNGVKSTTAVNGTAGRGTSALGTSKGTLLGKGVGRGGITSRSTKTGVASSVPSTSTSSNTVSNGAPKTLPPKLQKPPSKLEKPPPTSKTLTNGRGPTTLPSSSKGHGTQPAQKTPALKSIRGRGKRQQNGQTEAATSVETTAATAL